MKVSRRKTCGARGFAAVAVSSSPGSGAMLFAA